MSARFTAVKITTSYPGGYSKVRWAVRDNLMTQAMGHEVLERENIVRKSDALDWAVRFNEGEDYRLARVAEFAAWRATATPEQLLEYERHLD